MNPLTQIKNTQKASKYEIAQGFSESASWHARFKHSAYIFAGGLPFDLTEGDLLAIFAQYGELVDINLVKDKDTGKPRGFAFAAYEDQRSTVLAVDNLSGARVAGRVIRVEHVDNYKRKKAEMEGREPSPDAAAGSGEEGPPEDAAALPPPPAGPAHPAAGKAAVTGQDAWMGSSSLFSMLHEEAPAPRPARAGGAAAGALELTNGKKEKKAKKEHKDKKEKKEKKTKRDKQERVGARAERDVLQPPASQQPAAAATGSGRDRSPAPSEVPGAARRSRGLEDRDRDGSRYEERRDADAARRARRRSRSPADRRLDRDQRERGHRQRSRSPAERHRRR